MKSKNFIIKDASDLISALGDSERLYGYTPAEKYDANSFSYPVAITTNESDKTYVVEQPKEEVKDETKIDSAPVVAPAADNKKAKSKKIGMIIGFTILGVAVVVGTILFIYFSINK